jgi:hypothetical protein
MRTTFQDLVLLTFRIRPDDLAALLPPPIHPTVVGGWSFVSIVIASMRGMRVSGVPEFLGAHAYQIVYRAVAEVRTPDGIVTPGVHFLRSDCNDPVLSLFGNKLTEFRFHYFRTSAIGLFRKADRLLASVQSSDGAGDLVASFLDLGPSAVLPAADGFDSIEHEHRVLVELFHAFAFDSETNTVLDMEIERGSWETRRLEVGDLFTAFFTESRPGTLSGAPCSALAISECEYLWKPMRSIPIAHLSQHRTPSAK